MLLNKLAKLAGDMKRWQQLAEADPNLLTIGENQKRQAAIEKALPILWAAINNAPQSDPETRSLDALRRSCASLLRKWHAKQTSAIHAQAAFFMDNYQHYYIITVGQKPVSNVGGIVRSYVTSGSSALIGDATKIVLRNGIGEAVEVSIIALCSSGGAAVGNVPGAIIGFFVGITVDFIVNKVATAIFGDPTNKAIVGVKDQIITFLNGYRQKLNGIINTNLNTLEKEIDKWEAQIYACENIAELQQIEKSMAEKLKAAKELLQEYSQTNHPLGNRLLKHWALENMGNDNDEANDWDYEGVNEETWALAVQTLKDEGALEKTADDRNKIKAELTTNVINESLAFVHQVRNELRYTSIAYAYGRFVQFEKFVQKYAQEVSGDAKKIKDEFNGKTLKFRNTDITDAKNFVDQIEDTYDGNMINMEHLLVRAIQQGTIGVHYHVTMTLTEEDNTVFCTRYDYKMILEELVKGQVKRATYTWMENVD